MRSFAKETCPETTIEITCSREGCEHVISVRSSRAGKTNYCQTCRDIMAAYRQENRKVRQNVVSHGDHDQKTESWKVLKDDTGTYTNFRRSLAGWSGTLLDARFIGTILVSKQTGKYLIVRKGKSGIEFIAYQPGENDEVGESPANPTSVISLWEARGIGLTGKTF